MFDLEIYNKDTELLVWFCTYYFENKRHYGKNSKNAFQLNLNDTISFDNNNVVPIK